MGDLPPENGPVVPVGPAGPDAAAAPGARSLPVLVTHYAVGAPNPQVRQDALATEEPLEIRIVRPGPRRMPAAGHRTVAVTMRTPGHDFDLALGFLFAEGVIASAAEVWDISYCADAQPQQRFNIVSVTLAGGRLPDLSGLERHFFASAACGVCGRAGLETLQARCTHVRHDEPVSLEALRRLPRALRRAQPVFDRTGGLHAAALARRTGEIVLVREDVGRHNAVDKVVGRALADDLFAVDDVLVVSGRASFEIVQKAVAAGFATVAAVSAPSSLAVTTAEAFGVTLVGFLRGDGFNVYTGGEWISGFR